MKCVVTDMPRHEALRSVAAQWSFSEWGELYPDDSVQWYLDLYAASDQDERSLGATGHAVKATCVRICCHVP